MPNVYEPLVLEIEPPYIGSAFSPTVDIDETADDITVTITDSRGEHSYSVDKTDDAIADAEAAATNANNAASTAEAQGQQAVDIATTAAASAQATANAAAQNANEKATLADNAASTANTAAGNADDAASDARDATADAQAATQAANIATSNANAATSTATTAAQNADAKAALANTAASNADAKAVLANTAAANADAKATLADNAATSATTAAGQASTAAGNANDAATAADAAADAADAAREAIQDELAAKADADGYYQLLASGFADALPTGDVTVDTFAQRVSDHDGGVRIESLRGNTVRWNQLVSSWGPNETGPTGITRAKGSSGGVNVSGTSSTNGKIPLCGAFTFKRDGRKYLIKASQDVGYPINVGGYTTNTNTRAFIFSANSGSNWFNYVAMNVRAGDVVNLTDIHISVFDITTMFGAGNEPSTVEEFERQYPEDYYPYDAGSLLSVNVEGIESAGVIREIPAATYFPDGMRSAGSAYDELTSNRAITRIGSRAYQSGDESNTSVITDGTTTHYTLSTPVVVDIDPPLNIAYPTEQGGTESIVVPTGEMSAAPTMAVVYAYNADGVRDLSQAIIANIEGNTASANYAIGGYFVHAGKLYKATSAIATGEAINPGTNCTQTTVMAEIMALA